MLMVLMGIVFIVIGIAIIAISVIQKRKTKKKNAGVFFGSLFLVLGFIWLTLMFESIWNQHNSADSDIANNNKEYALLSASVCLLEENPAYEEKEIIIECVNEWNEKVENAQNGLKNTWTNWLYNKRVIEAMEHIEIPESVKK